MLKFSNQQWMCYRRSSAPRIGLLDDPDWNPCVISYLPQCNHKTVGRPIPVKLRRPFAIHHGSVCPVWEDRRRCWPSWMPHRPPLTVYLYGPKYWAYGLLENSDSTTVLSFGSKPKTPIARVLLQLYFYRICSPIALYHVSLKSFHVI